VLTAPPTCDYLLFVATSSEVTALQAATKAAGIPWSKQKSSVGSYFDLGTIGASRVVAVKTAIGALGHTGSISSAHFYLDKTQASGVICLGMAFGLSREAQPPGTVLVSEALFPYDTRMVRPDPDGPEGSFRYSYPVETKAWPCKEQLLAIFRTRASTWRTEAEGYSVQFGTLLAGSAKLECTAYRNRLVQWCAVPAIGGEMEGMGLLSLRDPGAGIVVKGVCD
jgi:nucleoside phosphorylase